MAKIELHPDFLRLLNSHGVEYLLVGGYSVESPVNLIALADPKKNKLASGRHKDLEDLKDLP